MCQVGALVASAAMALQGQGINHNPSTLNTWLKNNKGYVNKDDFVWASLNALGWTFEGKIPNALVRINIDVGYVVILSVLKGSHWVLATGYKDTNIFVNDPLHLTTKSYDLSAITSGGTGIYKVPFKRSIPIMIT